MELYKLCNFRVLADIDDAYKICLNNIKNKLDSYKPENRIIVASNYDNKSYLTLCYVNSSFLGLFLIKDKQVITEKKFTKVELNLFIHKLSVFTDNLINNKLSFNTSPDIVFAWLESLSFDLDTLRLTKVYTYARKVYNRLMMDVVAFGKKMQALADLVPEKIIQEFYGTTDVKLELRVYVALCIQKEIEPIKEDLPYFR